MDKLTVNELYYLYYIVLDVVSNCVIFYLYSIDIVHELVNFYKLQYRPLLIWW